MRLLVLNNLYPPQELGGYGRSLFDFATELKALGHQIQVLTSHAPYLGENLAERNVSVASFLCLALTTMGCSF